MVSTDIEKMKKNEYMKNYYRKKYGDNYGKSKYAVKYTDDQTKFILDNYQNMSDKNIGKVLGKTADTIQKKLKFMNLRRTDEQIRNNFLKAVNNKETGKPKKYVFNRQKWRKMVTISKNKRVLESHYVWCTQPGNLHHIPKGFVIHHYNGDCNDNSPDNLLLISRTDHNKFHNEMSRLIRAEL